MLQGIHKSAILSGLVLIMIMAGCSGGDEEDSGKVEQTISIKAMVVEPVSKDLRKEYTGTLEGERQAVIYAKIAEAVDKIYVREGDKVKANSAVIGLDKNGPSSNYLQSRSTYKNAEKTYNKMKYLYEQGAISETQFDQAETNYEVTRANFEAARQTVELTSPISGTVTSIDVSVGDFVTQGQKAATVATVEKLRMKFGVNAGDIKYFSVGDHVAIYVEGISSEQSQGQVVTVARSADPVTRTFQVEVEIDNSDGVFKPGMFARAEIVIESFEDILVIPHRSIVNRSDGDYVFVVHGDAVRFAAIKLGVEFDGMVQVLDGLSPSDTIVTLGQDYLDDGFKIRINELTSTADKEM